MKINIFIFEIKKHNEFFYNILKFNNFYKKFISTTSRIQKEKNIIN